MRKPLCVSVRLVILPVLSVQKGDLPLQGIGAIAPQQIAAMAQQQQLQNLTQQLQSQLSLQNMNLSFFNQVQPAPLPLLSSATRCPPGWYLCPEICNH